MTGYHGMIVRACGCSYEDAAEVEELMRLSTGGTLDSLSKNEFGSRAREAEAAMVILRDDDEYQEEPGRAGAWAHGWAENQ
jgi:hypothetical protein